MKTNCYYISRDGLKLSQQQLIDKIEKYQLLNYLDQDLLFHEILHPIVDQIDESELKPIIKEIEKTDPELVKFVKSRYSSEAIEKEIIVRAVVNSVKNNQVEKTWIARLFELINKLLGTQFITPFTRLSQLSYSLLSAEKINRLTVGKQFSINSPYQDTINKLNKFMTQSINLTNDDKNYEVNGQIHIRVSNFIQEKLRIVSSRYSFVESDFIKNRSNSLRNSIMSNVTEDIVTPQNKMKIAQELAKYFIYQESDANRRLDLAFNLLSNRELVDPETGEKIDLSDRDSISKQVYRQIEEYLKEDLKRKKRVSNEGTRLHNTLEQLFNGVDNTNLPYYDVAKQVHDTIKKQFKNRNVEYFPEFKVFGKTIDGSTNIAGTIDLLIVDRDTGEVFIYDYKSSLKQENAWNDGKRVSIAAQLLTYKRLLSQAGIYVADVKMIPIELGIDYTKLSDDSVKIDNPQPTFEIPQTVKNSDVERDLDIEFGEEPQLGKPVITKNNHPIREFMKKFFNYSTDEIIQPVSSVDISMDRVINKLKKAKAYDEAANIKIYARIFFLDGSEVRAGIRNKEGELVENPDFIEEVKKGLAREDELRRSGPDRVVQYIERWRLYVEQSFANPNSKVMRPFWIKSDDDSRNFDILISKYWKEYDVDGDNNLSFAWQDISTPESLELGILLFKNNTTGSVDIVNVSSGNLAQNVELAQSKATGWLKLQSRASIGSNFLTKEQDALAQLPTSTRGNIEQIKTALFIINNQNLFNDSKIESITTISVNGQPQIDNYVNLINNVKKLATNPNVPVIESITDKIKSFSPYTNRYTYTDYLNDLNQFYMNLLTHVRDDENVFKIYTKKSINEYIDSLKLDQSTAYSFLVNRQSELLNKINDNINLTQEEQQELILVNKLILAYNQTSLISDEADLESLSASYVQPDNITSSLFQEIRQLVLDARSKIKLFMQTYINNVKTQFQEYYAEVGKYQSILNKEASQRNLFEYDTDEKGEVYNTFRLRHPDNNLYDYNKYNQTPLTEKEKDLIRVLIKNINEIKQKSNYSYRNKDNIDPRALPLLKKSDFEQFINSVKRGDGELNEKIRDFVKNPEGAFGQSYDTPLDLKEGQAFKTKFYSFLANQNDNEKRTETIKQLGEESFVRDVEALYLILAYNVGRENEYNRILPSVMGIKSLVSMSRMVWFKNFPELYNIITNYIDTIMFSRLGVPDDQKRIMDLISSFKSKLSVAVLGLSPKTAILQGLQSFIATLPIFAGGLGSDQVSKRGLMQAIPFVLSIDPDKQAFMNKLEETYDILSYDIESLLREGKVSKTAFQWYSSFALHLNQAPDQFFRKIVWISMAIKDGTIKIENGELASNSAINWINSELVYQPKYDKRFEVYFNDDKSHPDYENQKAIYNHVSKIIKDEGYRNDNLPGRAYTRRELDSKSRLIKDMYADMSKENLTKFEKTLFGSIFFQFKRWILSKRNQYHTSFTNSVRQSQVSGKWKPLRINGEIQKDENGEIIVVWQGDMYEGILQTLIKTKLGLDLLLNKDKLEDFQIRNIKHAYTDMMLAGFFVLLANFADDDKKEDTPFETLTSLLVKSSLDNTIFNISYDIADTNPFVMISITKRFVESLLNLITFDDPSGDLLRMAKTIGITRGMYDTYKFINSFDN